ncbi:MAG: serine hydrolase domain-containing protein [Bacteroidota bacterium]
MERYFFTIAFLLVATGTWAQAYTWPKAAPATVGMSEARLSRLDRMLENAVKENQIPGAVALIARKGKLVYLKSLGHSNDSGEPLKTSDIFRMASQTKAVTATAVMMLWEEGHFSLDDPISKWIPEFQNPGILDSLYVDGSYTTSPANKEITIRHLITHTSGMGYGVIDADERFGRMYQGAGATELFTTEDITIKESVEKMASLPLHHHPGDKFTYSVGLDVLGYFIEIISGMPLDDFFRTRIFEPLGMEDTHFYLPENKTSRLVQVQTKENGQWKPLDGGFYDVDYPKKGAQTFFSGGAGLSGTAEDYAKFLQMYLNMGEFNGKRILSRKTVELIMANQFEHLWPNDGKFYGLAFSIVNEEGKSIGGLGSEGTFDWGGYFNTKYFADPSEGLIGILMKQTYDIGPDPTTEKFMRLVFQAIDD